MSVEVLERKASRAHGKRASVGEIFNSFAIENSEELVWGVRVYRVTRLDGSGLSEAQRGELRGIGFDLRRKYQQRCKGYGFVIDIAKDRLVLPARWDVPPDEELGDFHVKRISEIEANLSDSRVQAIAEGIVGEALRKHFKDDVGDTFGHLWQDYREFCELPPDGGNNDFYFCRRYGASVKILRGGLPVIKCGIGVPVQPEWERRRSAVV